MKYISTRTLKQEGVSSAYAIKTGLANDGGLFMPERIPSLTNDEILSLAKMSYPERAATVLSKFLEDYTFDELLADATEVYSKEKFGDSPAPVTKVQDNSYMLELWHGPTCAFKDMALQIMPRLFVRALRKCDEKRTALILVATSGDTGKAALEGYKNIDGTKIKVFYPCNGVSRVQKMQMQSQEGNNVSVDGIIGNFDDAQSGVKRIFADSAIAEKLNDENVFLSSANSINWGRLVPQIVYYVSAYCDLINMGEIKLGDKIDVSVPTGNFGNIFACYIAKTMGLPVDKLICASNINNVLTDFLRSGTYDKNRVFHTTMSPSMDILISSNLERLLFITLGATKTATYMNELNSCGKYTLSEEDFALIQKNFVGFFTTEEETAKTISNIYKNSNCLIDTHTAVAMNATENYMRANKTERKVLTVSTASPYKFAKDVYKSLFGNSEVDDVEALTLLNKETGVEIPKPLSDILKKELIHKRTIDKSEMENAVLDFAKQ